VGCLLSTLDDSRTALGHNFLFFPPVFSIRVKRRRNLFQLNPDPQPPAAFILRSLPRFWSIYSSQPCCRIICQLRPTVDAHHAALSPLPQPLRLPRLPPERAGLPSSPVALLGSLRLQATHLVGRVRQSTMTMAIYEARPHI
jgi:hypothetical protein